jgi:hypothetical protein
MTQDEALCGSARPPNKGMKLTKPSILELRSLSLVFAGHSCHGLGDGRQTSTGYGNGFAWHRGVANGWAATEASS